MAGLYDGLEETAFFKRAEGGYIYHSQNLLGLSRNYVVTEKQKTEIAGRIRDILREVKPVALAVMVIMPTALIVAATLVAVSGTNTLVLYASIFVVISLYIGLMRRYSVRRLQPLLIGLPRTSEPIPRRDKTANFTAHVPLKLLILLLSCMATGFAGTCLSTAGALIDGQLDRYLPITLPTAIITGFGTAYFAKIWFDRRKAQTRERQSAISR